MRSSQQNCQKYAAEAGTALSEFWHDDMGICVAQTRLMLLVLQSVCHGEMHLRGGKRTCENYATRAATATRDFPVDMS